ncbi:hypothetical protein HNV12_02385 [Methanococcoides sp. SA1]|nr:hypothetical protein [Methanococcoides sp. SA1]
MVILGDKTFGFRHIVPGVGLCAYITDLIEEGDGTFDNYEKEIAFGKGAALMGAYHSITIKYILQNYDAIENFSKGLLGFL